MRHFERNIQMAAAVTATATLYLLLGTAAVAEGMRVSPRQRASWQRSTSPLSSSAFSGRRKAGDGFEASAAGGAAAGRRGMGMRAFSAKRRVRSDVHNSIPMVQAQRGVSQRATLARQQQQQQGGAGPLFGVSPTRTAEAASSSGGAAAPSAVAGSQKKGVAAQGLAAKRKGIAKKTAQAPTTAKTRKRKGRGWRGRRLEPIARADAVELLRQAVVKYRGAQVSAASPTSSSASPASSSLPPPVASPPPSPSPSYSSASSYASSTGGVVSSGGAYGGSDGTSSYASISDGVVVIGRGVGSSSSSSSNSSSNGGETGTSRLSSSAPIPPASGDGANAGDTRSSTGNTNIDTSVRVESGSVGSGHDSTAVAAAAVAAEEFAELAARCLGSALPEIALEASVAHSLYVRAEASGLQPRTTALLPEYPLTTDDVDTQDDDDGHWRRRWDAEVSLLVTAARAHIAMGGVLDGIALIDDATAIGGDGASAAAALRAAGRWGGDGVAGAGLARLGDGDASTVAEELCVSGGDTGLRAALRLRERLAEEVIRTW
ncbi:unnamed protein product [Ectocarpus sp. CCAP 1310/34]|nr:unnamed protein product [Ectocarpus sp. CCAP 1310/34]